MIRNMRIKIVTIAMAALVVLMLAIFLVTNLYMADLVNNDTDIFLQDTISNEGKRFNPSRRGEKNHIQPILGFSLRMSSENDLMEVHFNDQDYEQSEMIDYVERALLEEEISGRLDQYKYQIAEREDGYLIVFGDTTIQSWMLSKLLELSLMISVISMAVLCLLLIISSKYITKPVMTAMEKQKRFIADSSHELKTPLSIMSANLEMLEIENGKNKRTVAISDGIKRMNNLIHELLHLARIEQIEVNFMNFNLSHLIESTVLPMEAVAYEQGIEIETVIEEDLMCEGYEEGMRKVIEELMKNAIKYAYKDSTIIVTLYRNGHKRIIEVYNECDGISLEERSKLFERFYRADDSRQRETGGHGLGLSIVKSIIEMHKGKILVESELNAYIFFRITLPR